MSILVENMYDHSTIEKKWQEAWRKAKLDIVSLDKGKPFYNLMMFPYPSAEGLHVGNMYAFTGSDIYGRYKRMCGYNVFEPIGLDGFGIHSENYSLKIGKHPMDQAKVSEKNFYRQLGSIGCMFDWSRTVETYDPDYYRWTQWLFVQMFKHGLAYRGKAEVNWCPSCRTVLADEQVVKKGSGLNDPQGLTLAAEVCERCGNKVELRLLEQWFFRITAYAEKLLKNTNSLKWSEKVLVAQRNWIGRKEGVNITYRVVNERGKSVGELTCFTTRPDTNFGATFVVVAPEHPFVQKVIPILAYVDGALRKRKEDRIVEGRKKTGVFTELYCINQLNNYKMPVFVSDFVVMDVGTGAVVGVPGHDKRDFEFALAMKLPVLRVVVGSDGDKSEITKIEQVQEEEGKMVNSGFLNGMEIQKAIGAMMDHLEQEGWGKRVTTYHLRDWLISRQRYWGPPIPMIYCQKCNKEGKGERKDMPGWYTESNLPVLLPRIEDYKPGDDGVAPLAKHKEFYETTCPGCGAKAVRETDVSDTFLDSSWYFLRYPSVGAAEVGAQSFSDALQGSRFDSHPQCPTNASPSRSGAKAVRMLENTRPAASRNSLPWDPEITRRWLPVTMYTGGAEHSVLHLMYSRFVTMALHDWGYLGFDEPFPNFYAHGLVIKDGAKMSKSKGNVVTPDEYIKLYGTDALRLYLMFMGPFDMGGDFRDSAMEGMSRWVGRVWRMAIQNLGSDLKKGQTPSLELNKALHKLIKKVTEDTQKRRYNTAIAAMMEFTNLVTEKGSGLKKLQGQTPSKGLTPLSREQLKAFLLLLAPFAPHLAEELWERLHSAGSLAHFEMSGEAAPRSGDRTARKMGRATSAQGWSVHQQAWPTYNPKFLEEETVLIIVQVNGKLRDTVSVKRQASSVREEVELLVRESAKVATFLAGKAIKKTIFVPGKLINFVV